SHLLYENLKPRYNSAITNTNSKLQIANTKIYDWIKLLSDKKANPFFDVGTVDSDTVFSEFNMELEKLKAIIMEHNTTSQTHQQLAKQAKKNIEYHFVSQSALAEKLRDTEKEITDVVKERETEVTASSLLTE